MVEKLSYRLKLAWADEQSKALNEATQAWLGTKPYELAMKFDAEEGWDILAVEGVREVPSEIMLLAGDVIQNMRNGLDHLTLALSVANARGPITKKVNDDSSFPITTSRTKFKEQVARGRLGCMPLHAGAVIHRAQPYRRGQDIATHPLWLLHQLSNLDKHRRLPLAGFFTTARGVVVHPHGPGGVFGGFTNVPKGTAEQGTVIARIKRGASSKVDVYMGFSPDVVLGNGTPAPNRPVRDVLREIREYIESQVVVPLERFL